MTKTRTSNSDHGPALWQQDWAGLGGMTQVPKHLLVSTTQEMANEDEEKSVQETL